MRRPRLRQSEMEEKHSCNPGFTQDWDAFPVMLRLPQRCRQLTALSHKTLGILKPQIHLLMMTRLWNRTAQGLEWLEVFGSCSIWRAPSLRDVPQSCGSAAQAARAHPPQHPEHRDVPDGWEGPCSAVSTTGEEGELKHQNSMVWECQSQSRNWAGHKQSRVHSHCLIKAIFGIKTHEWEGKQKANKLAFKSHAAELSQPFQVVRNREQRTP